MGLSHWQPGDRGPDDVLGELRALAEFRAEAVEADLSEPDSAARLFDELERQLGGRFSALVACHCRDMGGLPPLGWNAGQRSSTATSRSNARSVAMLIQELARGLPGDDGRVVAFTSDALEDNVPYGVTKAALDRVVKAARR